MGGANYGLSGSYLYTAVAGVDGWGETHIVNGSDLGDEGYSSSAIVSMNDNGYGVLGLIGILAGVDVGQSCSPPASDHTCNKTPLFKLTHDFGTTWQGIPSANDFYYVQDEVFEDILSYWPTTDVDQCTGEQFAITNFWSWNNFDMRVDQYGNPHIVMSIVAESDNYFHFLDGYTGWYHLTIDKDFIDSPGSVNSSTGWNWSYIPLPANDSFKWDTNYLSSDMCQLSFSRDNPDIVYIVANIAEAGDMAAQYDANGDGIEDDPCGTQDSPWELYPEWSQDIWAAKSTDGGSTWSSINNLTLTPRSGTDDTCPPEEQYVHTAHWSDDNSVRYVYQQPEWSYTLTGGEDGWDRKNRIFVGYSFIGDGGCDGEGNVIDACGICGGDGIPDGQCDCNGNILDECGVCNGNGPIFGDTGCCEAYVDECGVCDGNDSSCLGCTDPEVSNYDPDAIVDDGSCLYLPGFTFVDSYENNYYYISNSGGSYFDGIEICDNSGGHLVTITSGAENNFVLDVLMEYGGGSNHLWLGLDDLDGDGVYTWITGEAVQYTNWAIDPSPGNATEMATPGGPWYATNPYANSDYRRYMCEGEIELGDVFGCTDLGACNYNFNATEDDGSCDYPEENYDCEGNCIANVDCAGECGGSAEVDECGVCSGDNSTCCGTGDMNDDGSWNVIDAVLLVQLILAGGSDDCTGDLNNDGSLNVLDIVSLVNIILNS